MSLQNRLLSPEPGRSAFFHHPVPDLGASSTSLSSAPLPITRTMSISPTPYTSLSSPRASTPDMLFTIPLSLAPSTSSSAFKFPIPLSSLLSPTSQSPTSGLDDDEKTTTVDINTISFPLFSTPTPYLSTPVPFTPRTLHTLSSLTACTSTLSSMTPPSQTSSSTSSGLSAGGIAGVTIGAAVAVGLGLLVAVYVMRRRHGRKLNGDGHIRASR
jgi:hypothetical protein